MSIDRLLNPETAPAGHQVQEPREIVISDRTISGERPLKKDLGHRNWNQTIHHLFERRNDIRSSTYRDVPAGGSVELNVAKLGAYTIRFGGSASVFLPRPPRIPPQQDSQRNRWWSIRVRAFYASDGKISWPSNVIGARDVVYAEGGDGIYELYRISVLPGNAAKAGMTEVFDLHYDERTGEWFVELHVQDGGADDPDEDDDEAVDPDPAPGEPTDPETPPGEPTDPETPPEHTYTDPKTGDVMTPVQPSAGLGYLLAFHDSTISYSMDCGANWMSVPSPDAPSHVSALKGDGIFMAVSHGGLAAPSYFTQDLQTWDEVSFGDMEVSSIPIVNGGFEEGDLTGWTLESGTAPEVLDTVHPVQQEGVFYASSNLADPNFEISQTVEFAESETGNITVSARVLAEIGANAELEVRAGWDGETYRLPDVRLSPEDIFNRNDRCDSLSLIEVSGEGAKFIGDLVYITGKSDLRTGSEHLGFNFKDNILGATARWSGSVSNSFNSSQGPSLIDYPSGKTIKELTVILTNSERPGVEVKFVVPENWQMPVGIQNPYAGYHNIRTNHFSSKVHLKITQLTPAGYVDSASISGDDEWESVSLSYPASVGSPMEIILRGMSQPVYFDDVKIEMKKDTKDYPVSAAPDYAGRRHIVATKDSIYEYKSGQETLIAEALITPESVAADGDCIVLSDGVMINVSYDNGFSWRYIIPASRISQLFAIRGKAFASLFNGDLIELGLSESKDKTLTNTEDSATFKYDRRRRSWVVTVLGGGVRTFKDNLTTVVSQPIEDPIALRRTTPTDSGRWIGFERYEKDLFHSDDGGESWNVSPPLTAGILDIVEVR